MRNLPLLLDAICEAYDNPKFKADGDVTHCDASIDYVLGRFGFNEFKADEWMADSIIEYMKKSPLFNPIDNSFFAQSAANGGSLVIAGLTGAEMGEAHGHVAIVRPGIAEASGSWGKEAPKVMSNGSRPATTISLKMSYVFKKEPHYFALISTT